MRTAPASGQTSDVLPSRVFVYGTLLPGERNAGVAARGGPFSAQAARLRGFYLLHLAPEAYPALRPGRPEDVVRGMLLTYGTSWPRALALLDHLEGLHETPPLYTRERVTTQLDGGAEAGAWVYVYADLARLTRPGVQLVPDGDWRGVPDRLRPAPGER